MERLQANLDDLKREDDKLITPKYSFSDAVKRTAPIETTQKDEKKCVTSFSGYSFKADQEIPKVIEEPTKRPSALITPPQNDGDVVTPKSAKQAAEVIWQAFLP